MEKDLIIKTYNLITYLELDMLRKRFFNNKLRIAVLKKIDFKKLVNVKQYESSLSKKFKKHIKKIDNIHRNLDYESVLYA
jgi:hypothetical protein